MVVYFYTDSERKFLFLMLNVLLLVIKKPHVIDCVYFPQVILFFNHVMVKEKRIQN